MPRSHPTCQISTCCLSVSTLVPSLLLDPHSIVQSRKKEECYFPEVSSKDTVTVAYMCHRNKRDSIWYMIWYAGVCVCLCVHCVFFSPPLKAVRAVSPTQSVRLCELKLVVGGIWAGTQPHWSHLHRPDRVEQKPGFRETLEHVLRCEFVWQS